MLRGLVLAGAGFVLFVTIHLLVFHLRLPERRFRTMAHIAFTLGIVLIVLHWTASSDLGFLPPAYTTAGWAIDFVNSVLVYVFLFMGYSMFYFLVDRGFSGRIMIEIESSPERRLVRSDIAARYSIEMVLERRLNEMLEIGRIEKADGRYRNTDKGRRAAALFLFAKRFLQLGEGG